MSKTILASLIGAVATITAAFIGINYGKTTEQKIIQNEINEAFGGVVNVIGDGNEVTINDIKELLADYQNITEQKESLLEQNAKYFDDLTNANEEIKNLQSQMEDNPIFEYNSLGLSIDGSDILINKNKSMVTIDGQDYFSKEIIENLISDTQNISIKDNTLFVGKVVTDKANLCDNTTMDQRNFNIINTITDSYGNNYANALYCSTGNTGKKYIIYVLNSKYAFLKFKLAIRDDAYLDDTGIITIIADDTIVYTSENLYKTTEPFTVYDIPINNCKLLKITYDCGTDNIDCIISDAIVYN